MGGAGEQLGAVMVEIGTPRSQAGCDPAGHQKRSDQGAGSTFPREARPVS